MLLYNFRDASISVYHAFDEHFTSLEMHTHMTAEVYCLLQGRVLYRIEGNHYEMNPGDILLIRPDEAHHMQSHLDAPYERICINFDMQLFDTIDPEKKLLRPFFDRNAGTLNYFPADSAYTPYLKGLMDPNGNRATALANLILLMQKLGDAFEQIRHIALEPQSIEYRIIQYINHNLEKDLSLQMLCNHFYISCSQLKRLLGDATAIPVGRYIMIKRMLLARRLIIQGQKATKIYTKCGYKDYSAFYRAYKSYFGCSPTQQIPKEPFSEQ